MKCLLSEFIDDFRAVTQVHSEIYKKQGGGACESDVGPLDSKVAGIICTF